MVVIQRALKPRKPSGGKKKEYRGKRAFEKGNIPAFTKIGEKDVRTQKTKEKKVKSRLFFCDTVNLYDPKTKKFSSVKVNTVVESTANRNFVRGNIITRGTIVDTEKGRARITSRPGQQGSLDAVLI